MEHYPTPLLGSNYYQVAVQAAKDIGVPVSWVWYWIATKRVRVKRPFTRYRYVRTEDVQNASVSLTAVEAAFEATEEPIRSKNAAENLARIWPRIPDGLCEISQEVPTVVPAADGVLVT